MEADQVTITAGPWRARFDPAGARLASLQCNGVDLVVASPSPTPQPWYRGAVVAPWPNRVADGRYAWRSTVQHLPVNEPDRGNALHGLASWERWSVVATEPAGVTMTLDLVPRGGWPFHLELAMAARLDPTGLRWHLSATNRGSDDAPWGCTVHPYLRAPTGTVDDWSVQVPADRVLEVTPDRLLPLRELAVAGTRFDLRAGARLAGRDLDHAFTGLVADAEGTARATVRDASGAGVTVSWSAAQCPWVQVFSGDPSGTGVAIEPMTCPPDALNSGRDLVVLAPGATTTAWWHIGRDDAPA